MKHEQMSPRTRRQFRNTIRVFYWRKAMMPCYYKCPHEYVVRQRDLFLRGAPWRITEPEFQFLKKVIDKHGERVQGRHRRDVVLFDSRFAYWRRRGLLIRGQREQAIHGLGHWQITYVNRHTLLFSSRLSRASAHALYGLYQTLGSGNMPGDAPEKWPVSGQVRSCWQEDVISY